MQILIQKNNKDINSYIDVTSSIVSELTLDERIDQVLDSGTFSFLSRDFTNAIEPFTRCIIKGINSKYGMYDGCLSFFCTSNCNKYLTVEGLYYHEVQLYEPTKLLECLILGTKAFSHVEGKNNYNSNYDRIRIITELMNQKYDYYIELDGSVNPFNLSSEREYTFGAGTTMFDAINEIMKTEGCIPRLWFKQNSYYKKFILGYVKINELKTSTIVSLAKITKQSSTQSVDEYCSEMEAEYSEVVDRDTLQDVVLSCRSQGDIISNDTGCLILPSNIESLYSLSIKYDKSTLKDAKKLMGTKIILLPKEAVDASLIGNPDVDKSTSNYTNDKVDNYITRKVALCFHATSKNSFINELSIKAPSVFNELRSMLNDIGVDDIQMNINTSQDSGRGIYFFIFNQGNVQVNADVEGILDKYYLCTILDERNVSSELEENPNLALSSAWIDVTHTALNKSQWDLLNAETKPNYVYWESGTNYIDGFHNTFHDNYWESIIFDKSNSWIDSLNGGSYTYLMKNEVQLYWKIVQDNLNKLRGNNIKYLNETVPLILNLYDELTLGLHLMNIPEAARKLNNSDLKYRALVYNVKYYTKSPTFLRSEKTSFKCQIPTSRSYNNGANTIDYNLLIPAMQRAVDMQGLPVTTTYSKQDVPVGTRLEEGYVISKVSTIRLNGERSYSSYVYNLSPNYQQIAAAIGVDTQYEATNLPQTGIVTRFIELTCADSLPKGKMYLAIQHPKYSGFYLAKPLQILKIKDGHSLICEAKDNYCFDTLISGDSDNYQNNMPMPYSDNDCCIDDFKNITIGLLRGDYKWLLDGLPLLMDNYFDDIAHVKSPLIYKDARERLVFVIKHTGSILEDYKITLSDPEKIQLNYDGTSKKITYSFVNGNPQQVEAGIKLYIYYKSSDGFEYSKHIVNMYKDLTAGQKYSDEFDLSDTENSNKATKYELVVNFNNEEYGSSSSSISVKV